MPEYLGYMVFKCPNCIDLNLGQSGQSFCYSSVIMNLFLYLQNEQKIYGKNNNKIPVKKTGFLFLFLLQ